MRILFLTAIIGCNDGSTSNRTPGYDSGTNGDSSSPPITYPSGDRVLLYYGHGGSQAAGTGIASFDSVDAHLLATTGWSTDHRDYIPDDLTQYRMIGLIGPGTMSDEYFNAQAVLHFVDAMNNGTRLVVFLDREACATEVSNRLLADLQSELRVTGEAADINSIIQTDQFNGTHQIATDIHQVRFKAPCWLDPQVGTIIAQDDQRQTIMAAERLQNGGELVLSGDFQFFDDSGYLDFGDNGRLIENLTTVIPPN